MNPQDPAPAPINFTSVPTEQDWEPSPFSNHERTVGPVLRIPWDEQGFEARQPNIIHLYLLVVKLSWDEQAESGKPSLSVCHSDPFELLKALWRSRPPPRAEAFPGLGPAVCWDRVGCSSPGTAPARPRLPSPAGSGAGAARLRASLVLSVPGVAVADRDENSAREASACNGACAADAQG